MTLWKLVRRDRRHRDGARRRRVRTLFVMIFLVANVGSAGAIEFTLFSGKFRGSFDTTISTGVSIRTSGRDDDLIGRQNGGDANSINADNGNLNYDNGDVFSAQTRVVHELSGSYENYSLFVRGFYFYDLEVMDGNTRRTRLPSEAKRLAGNDGEILDAYVSGDYEIGQTYLNLRLGSQVFNWGESLFIQNGINAINPVDVSKLRTAGAEVREAFLPLPAVSANVDITENLSLEGFYQFYWRDTKIDPVGTYFSTTDILGPGAQYVFLNFGAPFPAGPTDDPPLLGANAAVPIDSDDDADHQGQWGVAMRWFEPRLNDTEFGLYFTRTHSKLPLIVARTGTAAGAIGGDYAGSASYYRTFPESINSLGASFNTSVEGIAISGQLTYRIDQPLQIDDVEILYAALSPLDALLTPGTTVFGNSQLGTYGFSQEIRGYKKKDVVEAQASALNSLGPMIGADDVIIGGEVGGTWIRDMESKGELRYEAPGTFTSANPFFTGAGLQPATESSSGFADEFSWGYRFLARAQYNDVWRSINLLPQIAFSHDVQGTTPVPILSYIEDRMTTTVSVTASYQRTLQATLAYTNYMDDESYNLLNDRDFVSFSLSYAF